MTQPQTDQRLARPDLREVERGIEERRELHERSIAAAQQRLQELHERAKIAAERLRLAEAAEPEPLGINEATAEELHLEGLTVMQATRFVAQRDRLGGFRSLDEVEQIEGIPFDTLLDLKSRAAV